MRLLVLFALALSFSTLADATPLYREDFLGESGFPTTPEVGTGGLVAASNGDGPPALPSIDGSAGTVTLAVQGSAGPATEGASVGGSVGSFGPSIAFFEASGTFRNFSPAFTDIGALHAGVSIIDEALTTNVAGILSDIPNGPMEIVVLEQTLGEAGNDQLRTTIPDAARSAILSGASYDIDLLVDRQLGSATATFRIGPDAVTTPSLTLTRLGSKNLAIIAATSFVLDFVDDPNFGPPTDFGADDSLSVELVELRAAIPEPSAGLLLGFGLVALATCRRRLNSCVKRFLIPSSGRFQF